MVYFAQLPTGAIKIGTTNDVDRRLKQLREYYGEELALLHVMDGDREIERTIHERFAALRYGRTEQFQPGPDLMEFIGKPLLVSANTEAVIVPMPRTLGLRAVRLELPDDVHYWLRVEAAKNRMSMAMYARKLIEDAKRLTERKR